MQPQRCSGLMISVQISEDGYMNSLYNHNVRLPFQLPIKWESVYFPSLQARLSGCQGSAFKTWLWLLGVGGEEVP